LDLHVTNAVDDEAIADNEIASGKHGTAKAFHILSDEFLPEFLKLFARGWVSAHLLQFGANMVPERTPLPPKTLGNSPAD
jgi:hypothetical protein